MFNFVVYRKFKSKNWNNMSVYSRIEALQKMEDIEAKKCGREKMKVEIAPFNENLLGRCDYNSKTIFINESLLSTPRMQFLALIVLFHEGRHAYQYYVISHSNHISRFSKAYKWKQNMENYMHYDGQGKFSYYSMQEVERDTNIYSIKRLKSLHFWFRNEDIYYRTLEVKLDEMEKQKFLAKKELGLFYKWKVNAKVRKKK